MKNSKAATKHYKKAQNAISRLSAAKDKRSAELKILGHLKAAIKADGWED